MPTTTAEIDPAAIARHFELIWGDHAWPDDARLAVSARAAKGMRPHWSEINAAALTKLLIRLNERADVWIGVAPHPAGTPGRGGKDTAIGLPALFADIDTDDGEHKAGKDESGLRMPTRDEAKAIMRTFPVGRLMVVDSGGGFHAWLPLQEILNPNSKDDMRILARWKRWWVDAFHGQGLVIDEGVLADVARILRPAGTVSWKIENDHRPVRLIREPGERVSLDDLDANLPQLPTVPERATRTTGSKRSASSAVGRAPSAEPIGDDGPERPGDALGHNVPVSTILEGVFGWECKGETAREVGEVARWWTPDGDPAYETHAATYADEGRGETVTVFDTRAQEEWGIPEITEAKLDENGIPLAPNQHRWTSWDLLGNVVCAGDWKLAARIALAHPTADDLIEALNAHPSLEEIEAAHPDPAEFEIATSLSGAIEQKNGLPIPIGRNTFAIIGGPNHGLQQRTVMKREDGTSALVTTQITDWIAYRPSVTRRLRITDDFTAEPVGNDTYEVVVMTGGPHHRFFSKSGMSAADSASHRRVVQETNPGVELPHPQAHRTAADNMLGMLGRSEQKEIDSYTSIGWALIDGRPVYLAPNGSVTPEGITDEYTTGPSEGSDIGGLSYAMRRTGFLGADIPIEESIVAINEFIAIAPTRPELPIAALGLIFSAPLHLTTRGVLVVTGESGSGKTVFSGAVQSFLSDVKMGNKNTGSLYIPSSSPTAATGIMAWYRDGTCIADDYRRTNDDKAANARAADVLNAIVQAGYGSSVGQKATQTGGMRGARDQAASALITAEVAADQTAISTRSISIPLMTVDRLTKPGGPIDTFLKGSARNGAARSVMAAYIQFLARRAARIGLMDMTAEMNERAHIAYEALDGARSAETVAVLVTGWQVFREFAEEAGVVDQIPSDAEVMSALHKVMEHNVAGSTGADPGRVIADQLASMVAGNVGHLLDHKGDRPMIAGVSPGWLKTISVSDSPNGGTVKRWDPKGILVGRLSEDKQYVLVGKSAVMAAARAASLDGLAATQVYDAISKLCAPGSPPGERCSSSLGIIGRPKGYVLPVSFFNLDEGDEEEPDDAPPTPASAPVTPDGDDGDAAVVDDDHVPPPPAPTRTPVVVDDDDDDVF